MSTAILREAARLASAGQPFVLATVVVHEPPQSAHAGAKAILLPDGEVLGWVGGGCVRPTVLREALAALDDGRPRLVRIDPDAEPDPRPGVHVYPMVCKGEGAVDVYLEPMLPDPELLVFGRTPVAAALARIAPELGYSVRLAAAAADVTAFPGAEVLDDVDAAAASARPGAYVVVATMGEDDEAALEAALRVEAAYVGLVASRKKGAALIDYVTRERGVSRATAERVKYPAGLDLGARTPAEIALTILAEILAERRGAARPASAAATTVLAVDAQQDAATPAHATEPSARPGQAAMPIVTAPAGGDGLTAMDPVCGMAVDTRAARHTLQRGGQTYYFCCPHCRARFERDPDGYLAASAREG